MDDQWQQERARWQAAVQQHFCTQRPALYEDLERWLDPEWSAAVLAGTTAAARPIEPRVDLFRLQPLRSEWTQGLLAEVRDLQAFAAQQGLVVPGPNSMNRGGMVLDDVGFQPLLAELVRRWLSPLAVQRYPELDLGELDEHHAFVAEYQIGRDEGLSLHVDDSEVTLNLCLGEQFQGGALEFEGRRCFLHLQAPPRAQDRVRVDPQLGQAVLHAGKDRHLARPIREGRRLHLIVWCRSGRLRARRAARPCAPWCGEYQEG